MSRNLSISMEPPSTQGSTSSKNRPGPIMEKNYNIQVIERTLRDDAEEQLGTTPDPAPGLAVQNPEQRIHELRGHQVGFEDQGGELRRAYFALRESRDQYLNLHGFAPPGCLTDNHCNTIGRP